MEHSPVDMPIAQGPEVVTVLCLGGIFHKHISGKSFNETCDPKPQLLEIPPHNENTYKYLTLIWGMFPGTGCLPI